MAMKPTEIEAWVLRVVDQVKKKQPCEDSRVELKSAWIDPYKAARQIAAHANASYGESILWIIGLNESKGIIGADNTELANWLSEVKSYFSEICPEVMDLNVPIDNETLVALLFSTERAPFVVKNSAYGQQGGGQVELEVPWREGRSTRSARRADLIRILIPISRLPFVEVLGAKIEVIKSSSYPQQYSWNISVVLYVYPHNSEVIAIPCHRCKLAVKMGTCELLFINGIWLEPRIGPNTRPSSLTIACTKTEAVIKGPGTLIVKASKTFPQQEQLPGSVELKANLIPAGFDKAVVVSQILTRDAKRQQQHVIAKWTFGRQDFAIM